MCGSGKKFKNCCLRANRKIKDLKIKGKLTETFLKELFDPPKRNIVNPIQNESIHTETIN